MPHGARLRTLLCVEDNPANLKLVEELIARRPDLRLLTAVNGTLGIELARAAQPEMILMDVNLPDISGIEAMKILREDPVTAHIPIVALSANAMPRDIKKGLEAGFFRYLTKPIKVNEFMDTLRMALEFAEQRAAEEGRPLKASSDAVDARVIMPTPRTTGLRILVAEDHPVNQEVARQILQRLGHHVEVAADGHAALAALEQSGRGTFDLVLMDVQMPVMGGLEATAAIRDAERASGTHLPIVALTAHAMHGDRERYLEAGMDGYVTKPIDGVELTRIIDQLVPPAAAQGTVPAAAVPVAPVAAGRPAFDERFIRARLGDNARLFAKLVRLFLEDCPARMRAMRRAIDAGDGEALREAAHALKGAAANFAAAPVVEAARQLELQGKNGDLSTVAGDVRCADPRDAAPAAGAPPCQRSATHFRTPPAAEEGRAMSSILIVEDDRSTRQFLAETLKTAGFTVASAKDGVEALKRLRAGSYDLMLLDVWMPKMNGLDVLAALPKEGARPRVVVMTADDTPETLLRVVREQAWRYVAKPVEPQALVELLHEVLAQTAVARRDRGGVSPTGLGRAAGAVRARGGGSNRELHVAPRSRSAGRRPGVGRLCISGAPDERDRMGRRARPFPHRAGRVPQGKTDVALSHRGSRPRFQRGGAVARRHRPAGRRSDGARDRARGKRDAAGWIRDSDRACESRRAAVQRKAQRGRVREVSGLTASERPRT